MMEYSSDPLDAQGQISNFWEMIRMEVEATKPDQVVFKSQELPLARIKKIMKLDEDVKCMMISAEAPILFAKAAELFIRELTLRAWIHTERNRRRTLHRNDIALAVSDGDTDQFDFLIDIVPRDDSRSHRRNNNNTSMNNTSGSIGDTVTVDPSKLANILDGQNIVDITNQASGEAIILNGNSVNSTSPSNSTTNGNGGQTVQFITTNSQNQNGTSNGQQVQYVLQLPSNSNTSNGAFQVQMVQPGGNGTVHVGNSGDGTTINGLPPGTVLQQGPNGTLQLVQLISSANSLTTQASVQNTTNNGTSNVESDQQDQADQKLKDPQNTDEIDTKINIQSSESAASQTIILQSGNETLISNDPLAQQQLIYTPVGSNQPVIISLADAIASGLVNEMTTESISDQTGDTSANNVASTIEISSSLYQENENVSVENESENIQANQERVDPESDNQRDSSNEQAEQTSDPIDTTSNIAHESDQQSNTDPDATDQQIDKSVISDKELVSSNEPVVKNFKVDEDSEEILKE